MRVVTNVLFLCALLSAVAPFGGAINVDKQQVERSFKISDDGSTLLKDGSPFRILSGSFHYFRAPHETWLDRMKTMKAAGLNTIQTYVAWNFHCPDAEDDCSFEGDRDLVAWVKMAQSLGLYVLMRPGPFICAEWDFGGLPAWLIRDNITMQTRTSNPAYAEPVKRWFNRLLPLLAPYGYHRGGNILMVQVENEYGTFAKDKVHLAALRDQLHEHFGKEMLLYSADPAKDWQLRNSAIEGVYQTVNFFGWGQNDEDVELRWKIQRETMGNITPVGPPFNDEYYPGWINMWGDSAVFRRPKDYMDRVTRKILITTSKHSNLNYYVFFGGTNFGFWGRLFCTTSYDYGAPVNESGQIAPAFPILQQVHKDAGFINEIPDIPMPPPPMYFGKVTWNAYASLFEQGTGDVYAGNARAIAQEGKIISLDDVSRPLSQEELGQSYGYVAYSFDLDEELEKLEFNPKDYAGVYFDGRYVGRLIDGQGNSMKFPEKPHVKTVTLLVDNLGRHSWFGPNEMQAKGLFKPVKANGKPIRNYKIARLPMKPENMAKLQWTTSTTIDKPRQGLFYRGTIDIPAGEPRDTMLDLRGFGKGFIYVNGVNIGRYWSERGPQYSYYCPSMYLKFGATNEVIVFEELSVYNSFPPEITFDSENYNKQMNM